MILISWPSWPITIVDTVGQDESTRCLVSKLGCKHWRYSEERSGVTITPNKN